MELMIYMMVLLGAVLVAGVICRFLPFLGAPIVQMVVGVLLALLNMEHTIPIDSHLFFMVFVAPLVYYCGMTIDKRTVWKTRHSILHLSVPLVIVTAVVVGVLLNWMIPGLGMVLSLMLMMVLSPTDDVAVDTVERHYHVPETMMELLKCESIFNEVISVVLFQSILGMVLDGTMAPVNTLLSFLKMSVGGLLIGSVLSLLKVMLVRWLRSEGIEGLNIHTLLGVIFPFAVYLIAEAIHVSGVVAVFISGLSHTLEYGRDNPDTVHVTITAHNIWQVLAYTLEGAAFVLVGMQLPGILMALASDSMSVSARTVLIVTLVISVLIYCVRCLWAFLTLPAETYREEGAAMSRVRGCTIFTLAGDRGAVTLATVCSIPLVLSDGTPFPYRDLILAIAVGVIVYSNINAHFILPFFVHKKNEHAQALPEDEIYIGILEEIVDELHRSVTPDNRVEAEIVIHNYEERISALRRKSESALEEHMNRLLFYQRVTDWQYEHTMELLEQGKIERKVAEYYVGTLHRYLPRHGKLGYATLVELVHKFRFMMHFSGHEDTARKQQLAMMLESNDRYVLEQLLVTDFPKEQRGYRNEYYLMLKRKLAAPRTDGERRLDEEVFTSLSRYGLQLELNQIQLLYESGGISFAVAKRMKDRIALLEMQSE